MDLPGGPGGNPDHVSAGAAAWEHLAWEMWTLERELDQRVRTMLEGWSGPGAETFEKRWSEVREGFPELDHRLHMVADHLRMIGFAIQDGHEAYDLTLAEAGLVGVAGIAATVLTVGGSDLVAGEADAALAASLAGKLAELGVTLSRLGQLLSEVAEALGNLASRFTMNLVIRGPELAFSPAGGAALGVGIALASGTRDPGDLAASAALGAADNIGARGGRGVENDESESISTGQSIRGRGDRDSDVVASGAELPSWKGPTHFDAHATRSLTKRGWTVAEVDELILHRARTVRVRDRHWVPNGTRVDEPATAYIDDRGNYVIRNDVNGYLVQVSRKDDPGWKRPFREP